MLDDRLDEAVRQRALHSAVDWADAWLGPYAGEVVAHPAEAATVMGVRHLAVQDRAVLTTTLEPMRRRPAHDAEMVSEARAGEHLRRLLREGDWWLVAGEDGYVGWIHDWVLRPVDVAGIERWHEQVIAWYARPLGTLWVSDHHAAAPLVLGTPLLRVEAPVSERGQWVLVATTTGAEGWIHRDELDFPASPDPMHRALACARMLMGTPYRWGGRSPLGFDCSGFVQFVARLAGTPLPRDAAQQQKVGESVAGAPEHWRMGDLLFFGERADHVGIYDGRQGMIHCRGKVRRDALSEVTPLMARLRTVRRPWDLPTRADRSLWSVGSMPGEGRA